MGSVFATDLAGMDLDIHDSIRIHLLSNHYPPVPSIMVEPCIEAIQAFNDEDFQRLIELPEGCYWRNQSTAPASAIVEVHHLDAWINSEEY